jgi:hypothetical protein
MATWTEEELDRIGSAGEITLESMRKDGSLRAPVVMWAVHTDGHVYVRAVNGRVSPWFRGTQTRLQGRVSANGVVKEVALQDADLAERPGVDDAYRAKYGQHGNVGMVLTDQAREATLRLSPR